MRKADKMVQLSIYLDGRDVSFQVNKYMDDESETPYELYIEGEGLGWYSTADLKAIVKMLNTIIKEQ